MKRILLMAHKMNLGGTEKALLSFINSLEGKDIQLTLLLLEDGGELRAEIPNWVDVQVLAIFESIKPIIFDPPLLLFKEQLKRGSVHAATQTILRYLKVKLTKSWYYNYVAALKNYESHYKYDRAIAYAGPSDFISYFIVNHVTAQEKYQWIHFDVSHVIYNTNFGNKFYSAFNKIFCVSENAKLIFDKMFPQYVNKTMVLKNIVSKQQLYNLAHSGATFSDDFDGVRILTLGRLSEEKGQQMIPNIVYKLKKDNLKFRWYLIGDGILFDTISSDVVDLGIQEELILLGSKINPYSFLRDCDLYVQTSFHEGYCLTVHEAKLFDKPVITTDVASASNLIEDKEDGLIVAISEQAIFSGVQLLLKDKALRDSLSINVKAGETVNEIEKLFI